MPDDEEELLRNLAALETKGSISAVDDDVTLVNEEEPELEPENPRKEYPVRFEMPHPRFNAQLTVQDDTLYIFAGAAASFGVGCSSMTVRLVERKYSCAVF